MDTMSRTYNPTQHTTMLSNALVRLRSEGRLLKVKGDHD